MGLVSELRRRNVFRMAVVYVVAAWLVMQVGEVLVTLGNLPNWVGPAILALLAVGFPIALIVSWFYELTPEGISLEKDVEAAESITHITGRRMDFIVIALLGAAVIVFAYDKWWTPPPQKSIAVLAFENMSGDPEQEYFSDGISEELLNLLAQIPELTVISRSSAFSFKGKDIAVPKMAEQLNVAHVLEGSVRKVGNRVRITVQLIETSSDSHLWSESFDRELDDIFTVQDEISAAVVEQLKVTLLGEAPKVERVDPEAYALLLQARHLYRQRNAESYEQSIALYEKALVIDPGYAAAWGGLARTYSVQANSGLRPYHEGYALARNAANMALAIDPGYAPAHATLGLNTMTDDHDLAAAARHFERALALDPNNTDILRAAVALPMVLGRLDQSIALAKHVITRDPVNPNGHSNLGYSYLCAGRWDDAIASFQTALRLSPGFSGAHYLVGKAQLLRGEGEAALTAIQREEFEVYRLLGLVMAHHALGRAVASDEALADLIEKHEQEWAYNIAYVLAYRNEVDRAFEWLDKAVEYGDPGLLDISIEPLFNNIHADPRWLPFLESIGMAPEQLNAIKFEVNVPQ
jgi:TolB-like protein/Tfp pilus assembly protein PilF